MVTCSSFHATLPPKQHHSAQHQRVLLLYHTITVVEPVQVLNDTGAIDKTLTMFTSGISNDYCCYVHANEIQPNCLVVKYSNFPHSYFVADSVSGATVNIA